MEKSKKVAVMSNELVLKSSYRFSLLEAKVVLYLISKIKPEDENFCEQIVPLTELANEIREDGGKYGSVYEKINKVSSSIATATIQFDSGILMPTKSKRSKKFTNSLTWFQSVGYDNFDGQICLIAEFNPKLKPFLLGLRNCFTKYHLQEAVKLNSQNALRLYQILKAQKDKQSQKSDVAKCLYSIEELKRRMGLHDQYKLYGHFKKKVILVAQKQLKENTSIAFDFQEKKEGRRVKSIVFTIYENKIQKSKSGTPNLFNLMVGEVADNEAAAILFSILKKWGITQKTVNGILAKYPKDYVEEKRVFTEKKIKEGKAKDPASFFMKALSENYLDSKKIKIEKQKVLKKEREQKVLQEKNKRERITELKQQHYVEKKKIAATFFTENPQELENIFTEKRKVGSITMGRHYDPSISPIQNYQNTMLSGIVLTELEKKRTDLFKKLNANLERDLALLK